MKCFLAVLSVAGVLAASQAKAATYSFQFTGGGETFAGSLTTSTTGASQLITSLTGTLNGVATTLNASGTGTYIPTNDNLIYPNKTGTGLDDGSGGYLDGGGLSFSSAGSMYNLYYVTASSPSYELDDNSSSTLFYTGNFTLTPATSVSAAPEPGSWALMLGGVGILGGLLRILQARRREDAVKDIATA